MTSAFDRAIPATRSRSYQHRYRIEVDDDGSNIEILADPVTRGSCWRINVGPLSALVYLDADESRDAGVATSIDVSDLIESAADLGQSLWDVDAGRIPESQLRHVAVAPLVAMQRIMERLAPSFTTVLGRSALARWKAGSLE